MKHRSISWAGPFIARPAACSADPASAEQQSSLLRLEEAVQRFNEKLRDIEQKCLTPVTDPDGLLKELSDAIFQMSSSCAELERSCRIDRAGLKEIQKRVRERTDSYFLQSRLMCHARTWPKGYPGDYMILEGIYNNTPDSEGIGYYLDWYFLSTILARAVRGRKDTMRDLLMSELSARKGLEIMNLGSGSCKETAELAEMLISSGGRYICIDADQEALDFCAARCRSRGLGADTITFRRYNALKMVNHERNLREFGTKDIIYSIGLFDYLRNDILIPLISALYRLLNPGGKLIFSFKDSDRYRTQEYHWLVDWDSFFQRTAEEHQMIIEKAGVSADKVSTLRDATGVVAFYIARR